MASAHRSHSFLCAQVVKRICPRESLLKGAAIGGENARTGVVTRIMMQQPRASLQVKPLLQVHSDACCTHT